jgi:hypothetical protein
MLHINNILITNLKGIAQQLVSKLKKIYNSIKYYNSMFCIFMKEYESRIPLFTFPYRLLGVDFGSTAKNN